MFKLLLLCLSLVPAILGQSIIESSCDHHGVETQQNFNPEAYLGKWHELQRYENFFQLGGDCVTATYGLNSNGTIQVTNALRYLDTMEDDDIEGWAVQENPADKEGKLLVKFPGSEQSQYWVVGTDYDNYSIVWSCYDANPLSIQFLWVLSRKPVADANVQNAIDNVLKTYKFNTAELRTTNNDAAKCGF